jgi:hypothetical protein
MVGLVPSINSGRRLSPVEGSALAFLILGTLFSEKSLISHGTSFRFDLILLCFRNQVFDALQVRSVWLETFSEAQTLSLTGKTWFLAFRGNLHATFHRRRN